jgi:hypothetical protein
MPNSTLRSRAVAKLAFVISQFVLAGLAHAQFVSISGGTQADEIPQGNSGNIVLEQAGIAIAGGSIWVDGTLDILGEEVKLTLYDVGSESHWRNEIRLGNNLGRVLRDKDDFGRGTEGTFTHGPAPFARVGSVVQASGLAEFEFWRIAPDPDSQNVVNGQSPMSMIPGFGPASIALAYLDANLQIVAGPTRRILVLLEDGGVDRDYDDYVGILVASPPPAYDVAPAGLNFGNVVVGTSSAPKNVRITNTGAQPLVITAINFSGVDTEDFRRVNNCPGSLPAQETCTVPVFFEPLKTGRQAATLRVVAGGYIATVPISGTGTD